MVPGMSVAGDSAGGNLALSLVLKLKEQKRILPRGLILFSPWTDLTGSGKSYETKVDVDPILNREYLDNAIAALCFRTGFEEIR